jgi:hypothetical protein
MYIKLVHCVISNLPTHLKGDVIMPEHAMYMRYIYEGESKIVCNVGTCCAIGYTAGWA